jgi:hypothetical protein
MSQKPQPKNCFVIMPIGDESSETRRRSDQVLKHIIKPAAESCGYAAIRADEIDKPGLITSQVIQRVIEDPLVIADLSETNPNVFYELAIRHAIKKPLVQIIEKDQRIPFDVAGTRTVRVDHKDMDSVFGAKEEIVRQIKQMEADPSDLETPISVSQDLQILKRSDNPKDRGIADLLSIVSDMRAEQAKILESVDKNVGEKLFLNIRRLESMLEENGSGSFRRRPPFRHMIKMLPEMVMDSEGELDRSSVIAVAASMFKDSMPWIYEIGMEAYRQQLYGDLQKAKLSLKEFRNALRMSEHPMMRDLIRNDKEMFFMREELDMLLHELDRRLDDPKRGSRNKSLPPV